MPELNPTAKSVANALGKAESRYNDVFSHPEARGRFKEGMSIKITTPAAIRQYTPGGKGGYGYRSTPLHRLVERRRADDLTACGSSLKGKIAVTDGIPTTKLITKHGLCSQCWPGLVPA